jgi:hypothetical protein
LWIQIVGHLLLHRSESTINIIFPSAVATFIPEPAPGIQPGATRLGDARPCYPHHRPQAVTRDRWTNGCGVDWTRMAELGDLHFDRTPEPDEAPPHRSAWTVLAVFVLAAIAGAAGYYFWARRPASPAPPRAAVAPSPSRQTLTAEPPADIDVPPLDETDPLVRQLVSELSSHPTVAAWLATDHLVRNFTVVVANIAERTSPATHLRAVAPQGPFRTLTEGSAIYIDPASYRRYDGYADAVAGLDARGTARLYATLKPRITDAYRDLGYPAGDFDVAFRKAILELLRTPMPGQKVALEHNTVMYTFADPALESLSPPQKQLLRMGPRNVRMIQDKLREIARAAGFDLEAP